MIIIHHLLFNHYPRVLLPNLTQELKGNALRLTEILRNRPETPNLNARSMLLDSTGRILASSNLANGNRIGSIPLVMNDLPAEPSSQMVTIRGDQHEPLPLISPEEINLQAWAVRQFSGVPFREPGKSAPPIAG